MRPFGMNYEAINFLSPPPPARAGQEAMDWVAGEYAELADVELPETEDDFELTIDRWFRYVKPQFRPFVYAWVAAISRLARKNVSAATLKKLRGMMRRDVGESAGILRDAKPEVLAAWVSWYPDWIESEIAERVKLEPWFLLPAEQYHRVRASHKSAVDTQRTQEIRDTKIGAELFAYIQSHHGMVRWAPGLIAENISKRTSGRRVSPERVSEMADALVRVDVARWRKRANGKPWAIQLTAETIPEPSGTLH